MAAPRAADLEAQLSAARQRAAAIDAQLEREEYLASHPTMQQATAAGGYQWKYFSHVPAPEDGHDHWDPLVPFEPLGVNALGEMVTEGHSDVDLGLEAGAAEDEQPIYATVLREQATRDLAAAEAKRAAKERAGAAEPIADTRTRAELVGAWRV